MVVGSGVRDHPRMNNPIEALRVPRGSDRVIAGVASGWADRWGIEPTVVRAAVGLLTLAGGLGVVLYAVAAVASVDALAEPPAPLPSTDRKRRELAIGCVTMATLLAARAVGLWPGDGIMIPATAVAIGISVVWTLGGRSRPTLGGRTARAVQVIAGVALLIAGVASLASRTGGLSTVGASAGAIAVVVGGLAIFAAPALGRLLRRLDAERGARIREDERANLAAHLHDSVLQSLVLIQRTADPRRMTTLARRQERELRAWLYGMTYEGEPASLHAAIDALGVAVESDHDIRVEAVVVGDQPLDDAARALVAAVREAVVNAARHADVDRVDVFVEVDEAELTGFVRDTGRGFDPADVAADRRGISESIVGRVQRVGGTALLISRPGSGTEIELRVPRVRP
jgi:signal transduction histidine kinase/phage shock protein PspC (stress-responsive transcriptional regulator)